MKKFWVLGVVIIVGLAAVTYWYKQQLPTMPAVAFRTLEGQEITSQSLKGKVTLVNFWATNCPACVKEMPDFKRFYQTYQGKGFQLIAVAMPYDVPQYVLNFSQDKALPFPIALDPNGQLVQAFGGVQLTPTSFLINQDGKIVKRYVGELNYADLEAAVQPLLNAKQ